MRKAVLILIPILAGLALTGLGLGKPPRWGIPEPPPNPPIIGPIPLGHLEDGAAKPPRYRIPEPPPEPPIRGPIPLVAVEIKINGETVFYDPDDPATQNFLKSLAWLFGATSNWVAESGGVYAPRSTANVLVAYTTVQQTYDPAMSSLSNKTFIPATARLDTTLNQVLISGTETAATGYNITGIALYVDIDTAAGNGNEILLFYDPLPQPITVNPNDIVTIAYIITPPTGGTSATR